MTIPLRYVNEVRTELRRHSPVKVSAEIKTLAQKTPDANRFIAEISEGI